MANHAGQVSPAVVPGAKDAQGRRPRRRGKRWQTPVSAPTSLAPSHPVGSDASLEPVTGADPEGLPSRMPRCFLERLEAIARIEN